MKKSILLIIFLITISSYSQSFDDTGESFVGVSFGAASFVDYNQDGNIDILITGSDGVNSSSTKLYKNDGHNFFEVSGTGFPDVTFAAIDWADFNNDGHDDLLIAGYIEGVEEAVTKIFKNNGDGTFTDIVASLPRVFQGSATWVDFNNDGFFDFSLSGFDEVSNTNISKIFKNNQDETFSEVTATSFPGTLYGKMKWADYNNDTFQDFVLTGLGSDFITEIWTNNGDETFSKLNVTLQKCWLGDIEWGDFNNDSYVDLFVTGDNGGVKYSILYKNEGGTNFTNIGGIFPGLSHSSVEWADFDSDGDLDLFLAGTGDAMGTGDYFGIVFKNNGGSFSEYTYLPGTYWGDCLAKDFNGDGNIDILLNGYDTGEVPYAALYKNDGVTFVEELDYNFNIYPNPAKQHITIANLNHYINQISIKDLSGRVIYSKNNLTENNKITISSFSKGMYFVTIQTGLGETTKKLLIE